MNYQGRGHPQGNIDKMGNRMFPKLRPKQNRTFQDFKIEFRCFRWTLQGKIPKGYRSDSRNSFEKGELLTKSVFATLRSSTNGLQRMFWNNFCTKPTLKIITKRLESPKLSGKVEI